MIELKFGRKSYWLGRHATLRYIILDPLLQNAEWSGYARLFVLSRNRSNSFCIEGVNKNLLPDAMTADYGRRLTTPYATAFKKLRDPHCYYCKMNLLTTNFGICDRCGWIQCTCGACGCFFRGRPNCKPRY